MVEIRDRGGMPGVASQRTRLESIEVVAEVYNDDYHGVVWDATGRFVRDMRLRRGVAEEASDLDFTSTPNCSHAG